jgi:hypothetical protein
MRFLITPEIDGIGIYPCSINARILTKPLLKSRPVNRLLALDHGRSGDSRLGDGRGRSMVTAVSAIVFVPVASP